MKGIRQGFGGICLFLCGALSLGSVSSSDEVSKAFTGADVCGLPSLIFAQSYLPSELQKVRSAITVLRSWEKASSPEQLTQCQAPQPPVKDFRFVHYVEGSKKQSIFQVTSNRKQDEPFKLKTATGEMLKLDDKYRGFAGAPEETPWQTIPDGMRIYPGRYELQWSDQEKRVFPFLFCMDMVGSPLRAQVVRGEKSKDEYYLEVDMQTTRCYSQGETRNFGAAAFLGSPQTPSVWHHDEKLPPTPKKTSRRVPIALRQKPSKDQRVTLFVFYFESYLYSGIEFGREHQIMLQF